MSRTLAWLAGIVVVIGALVAVCLPTAARAQTPAEIRACYPDAVRLCGVKPDRHSAGVGEIISVGICLLWKRNQLSPQCRAVFAAHGK